MSLNPIALKGFYALQHLLHKVNIDIGKLSAASNLEYQVMQGLKAHGADLVLDVGANKGQYASQLRRFGYQGRIVSFEPLPAAYDDLVRAARGDPKWNAHERCAIGAEMGTIDIHVAANSVSSSALPITDVHTMAAQASRTVRTEHVPLVTLDAAAASYLEKACKPFLKIDTQGFEWAVLDGASATLEHVCGVQCEVSLVELYSGQHLWREVLERLEGLGFRLWGIQNGFSHPDTGASLQFDVICFRP